MDAAAQHVFRDWTLPIPLTVCILLTAAVYVRGWLLIRRTRPEQFTITRLGSFLSGLAVLWISIGSPMDGFADALLSAHMVEHLLLMSVVPPLVLLGLPAVPLLRGLPGPLTRAIAGPLLRMPWLRRFGHWLVTPLPAWLLMNAAFLGWHIPGAYDFALDHENWHAVEHLCFLGTSLLFWFVIIRPWPAESRDRSWTVIGFLISADLVNTILSASLAFAGRPVYAYYVNNPNPFGVSLVDDQVTGAVIMWVAGSTIFLVPAMGLAYRLISGSNTKRIPQTASF